jgi:hypothetical protein
VNADDVRAATAACLSTIEPHVDRDWDVVVPDMAWTVADAAVHVAAGGLWYSVDLSARGFEIQGEITLKRTSGPAGLVATIGPMYSMLALVIDCAPAEARGYHPFGMADASGFAAMACDELLVHTDDMARGLGVTFVPDAELCERVLARIFSEVPPDPDPWTALLWANGRLALPDRPKRDRWRWHCAPLEEQR